MATWSGKTTPNNIGLSEKDLKDLYETLHPVRPKYKSLALQLDVLKSDIESIEAKYSDPGDRLLEILTVRIKQTAALTWTVIVKALRSKSVCEYHLADTICERHVYPSSNQEQGNQKGGRQKQVRKKEDSEDEESDSDDSGDESYPTTSEEEGKKSGRKYKRAPYFKRKGIKDSKTDTKKSKLKKSADLKDLPGDEGQSDPGGGDRDQEEHDIQPKTRCRRRHKKYNLSLRARSSFSPSNQNQPRLKEKGGYGKRGKQKRKNITKHEDEHSPTSSENDSSPECDMGNGSTEAKKKKLSEIFRRFFGKLCCAIANPIQIAAQLQEKRLISQKRMIAILRSPESEQEKTIGLISKLNKKIDRDPECLFVFVEVLLQNDILQNAGKKKIIIIILKWQP